MFGAVKLTIWSCFCDIRWKRPGILIISMRKIIFHRLIGSFSDLDWDILKISSIVGWGNILPQLNLHIRCQLSLCKCTYYDQILCFASPCAGWILPQSLHMLAQNFSQSLCMDVKQPVNGVQILFTLEWVCNLWNNGSGPQFANGNASPHPFISSRVHWGEIYGWPIEVYPSSLFGGTIIH